MNVKVLGPTTKKILKAEWIDVKTTVGSFLILPGHEPLTVQLIPNTPVSLGLAGGAISTIPIQQGIFQVNRRDVTIILDE